MRSKRQWHFWYNLKSKFVELFILELRELLSFQRVPALNSRLIGGHYAESPSVENTVNGTAN